MSAQTARLILIGDTVYFKYGKTPVKATITALNFKEACVTVQVAQPLPRGMTDAVRDLTIDELVFTGRSSRLNQIEELLESGQIVATCLCGPINCNHEKK